MIGALGSTCDPTVLVSGSLAALRGDADELEARAGALEDAAADVEHRVVEAWVGDSADAYGATTAAPRRIGAPALGVRASQRTLGTSAVAITTRPPVTDPVTDPVTGAATVMSQDMGDSSGSGLR